MSYLINKLRNFGTKNGFIPKIRDDVQDDLTYADSKIKDIAYQVKSEIEDYFAEKEGVLPFHWHNINLRVRSMPCHLEYVVDWGKKVLNRIKGYAGYYAPSSRNVYINKYLVEGDMPDLLKSTIKRRKLLPGLLKLF